MERIVMKMSGVSYFLAQDQDRDQIETAAVEAVRAGGGIIRVALAGDSTIGVLVSPGLPLTFEQESHPVDTGAAEDFVGSYDLLDFHEYDTQT